MIVQETFDEPVDRLIDVGGNLYRFEIVAKFSQSLPFDVHKDSGLICIHPIAGTIAHYEYATDAISFYKLDGTLEKTIKLARSMASFQWTSGEKEQLLCYFSDYHALVIDYSTLETVSYPLSNIFCSAKGKEFVLSAVTIKNNRIYAIMSGGELFVFFGWKSDGLCQVLIYETRIRFCVELCPVNDELLYGYNREFLYSVKLKEKAVVCKFIESSSLLSPIYLSTSNTNLFAVVFADRDPNLCQLKVYNVERACISYSLKLDYLPLGVHFLCNNSFIIASATSISLVNNETFREEQLYEPISVLQMIDKQCLILSATGLENVTFCSKQVENLKTLFKEQRPFTSSDIEHSCENVETIFEIALFEWNSVQQNILIEVASHLSCYLAAGEFQKEKLEKCIQFIRFIDYLRKKHKIGCFSICQKDISSLAQILIRTQLYDKAFMLCKIFPSSQLKEDVFFGWLLANHSTEPLAKCRKLQQEMGVSNERLLEFCLDNSLKEFVTKAVAAMNDIQLFCRSIKHQSLEDVEKQLKKLSNDEKVHSIYCVMEKFFPLVGHSVEVTKCIEMLSKNPDISRYFQDFTLYRTEYRQLLSKFYYSIDANDLLEDLERLSPQKSFSLREMERQTTKLHEFQEELAVSSKSPLVLNMSLLQTRSLVLQKHPQLSRFFSSSFLCNFE